MKIDPSIQNQIAKLPHTPGVYLFYDKAGDLLYVGKSGSLKSRVQSYFRADFAVNNAAKQAMVPRVHTITHRITDSEVEALILEAALIKKLKPRFNRLMADDKSYRWVAVTKEPFPKIFITHEPRPRQTSRPKKAGKTRPSGPKRALFPARERVAYLGPFTEALALKQALKALRRIFPFCTCPRPHARPCLNSQLGLCPGYCCLKDAKPTAAQEATYKNNIIYIQKVLRGQKRTLVKQLKGEMAAAAKAREYEKAARLRDTINALATFMAHRRVLRVGSARGVLAPKKLRSRLLPFDPLALERVECYDISNIQGRFATASMVVFSLGEPAKNAYRKFRIRRKDTPDDFAMLAETMERRLNHPEWPLPRLFLIDGGIGQRSAVTAVLKRQRLSIPVFALAKREELLYTGNTQAPVPLAKLPAPWASFFMRIRDEAHRFAITYHRFLRDTAQYRNV